ncbi:phytoene desaturase family protein [Longimicrobium terrae]|uniref:Phytoene dehydrogenase-like protein n=1 Tax=Longimicrobium terrae TaxID=1639882 RepID=A0A841GYT6_9BACT|nr:NAD(P)/FAD-dependent oxidoreductase [Longimicrobium terrae]MBB4636569.1 phytoene dehydrogenase-like protein [Longimicrobium terrae]MBB6070907.1 phytoene dehydrogenase-like protein [Longimicrobium terrae]NNC28930.1 NAD(P)/FAD-dependent oxidoreductase [Longimicrobium terrae]
MARPDAVVVGSGPNGLSAAIALARAGRSVVVREQADVIGGGMRTEELTLPGYMHDVCSTVHPLGVSSPFFRTLPLEEHGLEWVHSPACLAHPFDDGSVAVLERSMEETGATLGVDAKAWRKLFRPWVDRWLVLAEDVLGPLDFPDHPFLLARFGLSGLQSAYGMAKRHFRGHQARALFAGNAAHSMVPLTESPTAAFGLTLAAAGHAVGWPIARGGSRNIAGALASYLRSLGGEIITGAPVDNIDELRGTPLILLDLTPRQVLRIAGHRLPSRYRAALERYKYGAGSFKMDWALKEPIPWRNPECRRAATVHLGGTMEEVAASEHAPLKGRVPEKPFVLVVQPTLFDRTRAPAGGHIAWAYCHVPFGSDVDMTRAIEDQIERFAPGFRDVVAARSVMRPADLERHNPNLVGGDISAGAMTLRQVFFRPALRRNPYATPVDGLYLCSASTPPGGAVHGMCGYYSARAALRRPITAPTDDGVAAGEGTPPTEEPHAGPGAAAPN